jgi:hypothetical protein
MKQDAAFFEDKESVLIYIAKKLKEALRLETALTEAGIDYGVEADEYRGGVVFRSARVARSSTCCPRPSRRPTPPCNGTSSRPTWSDPGTRAK